MQQLSGIEVRESLEMEEEGRIGERDKGSGAGRGKQEPEDVRRTWGISHGESREGLKNAVASPGSGAETAGEKARKARQQTQIAYSVSPGSPILPRRVSLKNFNVAPSSLCKVISCPSPGKIRNSGGTFFEAFRRAL
jgi:hypothetical protein